MVYLALGLMPFAVEMLPGAWRPNIEWRGVPFITGVLTTVVQFMAGVGGLFLDIFFQKSMLDRKTTLATKAVAQTASHVLRAVYFVSLRRHRRRGAALAGRRRRSRLRSPARTLAPYVIERMTDHGFRQWTRLIIFTISVIYLARAGWLFWHG